MSFPVKPGMTKAARTSRLLKNWKQLRNYFMMTLAISSTLLL